MVGNYIKVLTIQQQLTPDSPLIFPKRNHPAQPFDPAAPYQALTRYFAKCEKEKNPWAEKFSARDLRRTFKTHLAEIGISKETRDQLQAHKLGGTSSKHYDRHGHLTKKRSEIAAWEHALSQWVNEPNWDPSAHSENILRLHA